MAKTTRATCFIENDVAELFPDVWSVEATDFIAALDREFSQPRQHILHYRKEYSGHRLNGGNFEFLSSTAGIRNDPDWRVPAPPKDLIDRRVEIAGPAENRKIVINALNAHAQVWVADLEDAMSPTWHNAMASQRNLKEAVMGDITYLDPRGKHYRLEGGTTAIVVRPRGWHLPEQHVMVDGQPASASLVDFGLYFFHCARRQLERGSGPYFYLPKLENHLEAKLWNDVFEFAQDWIGVPRGSIRATVLIEHIGAAYEMDEILHALSHHAAGLTAGRWDYLFSITNEFRNRPDFILPDRAELTMGLPFMRAYTELLVRTCHRRGTHALGGVATQIPDRHDPEAQRRAVEVVRRDKEREAAEGFDGTWVVHPDLVPVCHAAFDRVLSGRPHQIDRSHGQVSVFWPAREGGSCCRCLFPEPPPPEFAPNCAEAGVLGVLPGVIGLLQATEAIKLILGIGESLSGTLPQFDALGMRFNRLRLLRNPACPRCGDGVKAGDYVDLPAACRVG